SPAFTFELKSAESVWIVPEICVPTWTSSTGCTVPLAATPSTISPRSTLAVRYCTPAAEAGEGRRKKYHPAAAGPRQTTKTPRPVIGTSSEAVGKNVAAPVRAGAHALSRLRRRAERLCEPRLGDLVVRPCLDLVRARSRQRLLCVGELDGGSGAGVETSLREL